MKNDRCTSSKKKKTETQTPGVSAQSKPILNVSGSLNLGHCSPYQISRQKDGPLRWPLRYLHLISDLVFGWGILPSHFLNSSTWMHLGVCKLNLLFSQFPLFSANMGCYWAGSNISKRSTLPGKWSHNYRPPTFTMPKLLCKVNLKIILNLFSFSTIFLISQSHDL